MSGWRRRAETAMIFCVGNATKTFGTIIRRKPEFQITASARLSRKTATATSGSARAATTATALSFVIARTVNFAFLREPKARLPPGLRIYFLTLAADFGLRQTKTGF